MAGLNEFDVLATNLRVISALLRLDDLLSDLEPVVFKGPLLTDAVYGDLQVRASADNDLWVRTARAPEALRRLLDAGYEPERGVRVQKQLERAGQVALWPFGDPRQISVDLHVRPFRRPYFEVPEALILDHVKPVVVQGRSLLTFDAPLSVCHLAAHFLQHHLDDGHLDLISDAYERLRATHSAEEVWELALRTGTQGALWLALSRSAAFHSSSWRSAASQSGGPLGPARSTLLELPSVDLRTHVISALLPRPASGRRPRPIARKFLALWLSGARNLPAGAREGLFPDPEELRSRYGDGPWLRSAWLHLRKLFARG